jgi:hypothetical protein
VCVQVVAVPPRQPDREDDQRATISTLLQALRRELLEGGSGDRGRAWPRTQNARAGRGAAGALLPDAMSVETAAMW